MKKIQSIVFALTMFGLLQNTCAQTLADKWAVSFSNPNGPGALTVEDAINDSDGNSYILTTAFTGSDYDAILIKFDADGNKDWHKEYSSVYGNSEDYGVRLALDKNDNIYALININPDEVSNANEANGFAIKKYNTSGTELDSYENVNNASIKLGEIANDLIVYEYEQLNAENVYVASSKASAGMGLKATIRRLNTSLAYQASHDYDSNGDDIAELLEGDGAGVYLYIRQGTTVLRHTWIYNFTNSSSLNGSDSYTTSSTIASLDEVQDFVVLGSLTNGTQFFGSGSATYFSSDYTINDMLYIQPQFASGSIYFTGSKTVSGHEELVVMRYQSSLLFEELLDTPHGSLSSVGYSLHANSDNTLDVGGTLVSDGTNSFGSVTFNYVAGTQKDISPYNGTSTKQVKAMLAAPNDGNVLVTASGSSIALYAQCNGPSVDLGEDFESSEGDTETLGSDLPFGMTYLWSTGATTRTINVTVDGTYTVTVTNNLGCPASDDVTIDFLLPIPGAPKWLMPELLPVSGNGSANMRLKWVNDDALASSHVLNAFLYTGGNFDNNYGGNTVTGTSSDRELNGDEWRFQLVPKNDDDVSGSATTFLTFRSCGYYDMTALGTYMAGLTLNGTTSVSEAGGTASFNLSGFNGGDDELDSYFEWTLPSGWTITEYNKITITADVAPGASSGVVSVRIVNPCTEVATSARTRNVYVIKDQTITFNQPSDTKVGETTFDLGASATSGLDISYEMNPTDILEISDGIATPLKSGSVTITASQGGNAEWNAASNVERTMTVNKGDDVITLNALSDVIWNASNFDLDDLATSKSGRQISWSGTDEAIAQVTSIGAVNPISPGVITITGSLAGNVDWNAAPDADQTLTILKADQTITFDPLPDALVTDEEIFPYDYISTTTGSLPILVSSETSVAVVAGGALTIEGAGTTIITASLTETEFYNSAASQQQSFTVDKLSQEITFDPIPTKTAQDEDFDLEATSSSTLMVTYSSSNTSVATVSGSTVSIIGVGTTTISASQSGDATYAAATTVNQQLTIEQGVTVAFDTGYPQFDYFCCGNYKLFLQLTGNGNVYYIVAPDGSSAPTAQQIQDQKNASGESAFKSGSAFSLQAGVENSQTQISGLAELTAYDIYLVVSDESFDLSPVVTKLEVMTQDRSAPTWTETYPKMGTISSQEAEVQIDLNEESGTVYYAVFSSSSTTRFPANLKNGSNFEAIDEGSITADDTGFTLTGLSDGTDYDVWLVAEDASENLQPTAAKIDFSTISNVITWSGTAWSNGSGPSISDDVLLNSPYITADHGEFNANSLEVSSSAFFRISEEHTVEIAGDVVVDGEMIVVSGASLITYEGNMVADDIYVYRNTRFEDGRYSFVGTPVEQSASITGEDLGTNVYKYNEVTPYGADGINRWISASSDELIPGKGYTQANLEELSFRGRPNTGTIVYSGTYTQDALDANEGWNLVANPYAAAINTTDFLNANMNTSGSLYLWDDNGSDNQRGTNADYIVANGTMASSTQEDADAGRYNNNIGSAQAFFVKLNSAANADITFTETMRRVGLNGDANFFRETELPIVRLNLKDNQGLFKQAVVGFADDVVENELNRRYDAQAFNASADFGLFTMKAGRSLTLNGMTRNWEVIQLQLNVKEAGLYQIAIQLENYDEDIYLRDNLTGEMTNLRNGAYSFTANAGIQTDRFELLSSATSVLGLEEGNGIVYANNSILHIKHTSQEAKEYQLFNMNGQKLLSTSVKSKAEINLSEYAKGIYLVFDGEKTHKIILE